MRVPVRTLGHARRPALGEARLRALPAAIAVLLALACAPKDATIRRARAAAETRNLAATFDRLEERLVMTQARVRLWQELRARHESVSAIACASLDSHAEEMAAHHVVPPQPPSRRQPSSLHRARVAAASTGGAGAAARVPASSTR